MSAGSDWLQSTSRSTCGRVHALSFSLEFLHFILRFWNQIFTCMNRIQTGLSYKSVNSSELENPGMT